jgi:hypothetical protein
MTSSCHRTPSDRTYAYQQHLAPKEPAMPSLLSLQITLMTLTATVADSARDGAAARMRQLRDGDRQAGLSTLEIAIIALGLFLIAGVAVLALTNATNTRLNQIQ